MADVASPPPAMATHSPSALQHDTINIDDAPASPQDPTPKPTDSASPNPPSKALTTANKILSTTLLDDGTTVQMELTPAGRKIKKVLKKKQRPARVQIDPATLSKNSEDATPQTGTVYNVWYNKWSGGDSGAADALARSTPSPTRVNIAKDSGYTAADGVRGALFCLFFARGTCPKGRSCAFLHRLPTRLLDMHSGQSDIFGREKHADYRDDMGGVGTFTRTNRTLYIGRCNPREDIEEVVARHFAEFGDIERVRCLTGRGVAFVTYATEALAQFAKEAMDRQALDDGEVLNVKWATQDPNPVAQKREARAIEAQAAAAIKRCLPDDVVREIEGDEGAKRRRLEGGFGLEGFRPSQSVWMASQRGELGAPEQPLLIEDGEDEAGEESVVPRGSGAEEAKDKGFFGASTLKALHGFDSSNVTRRIDLDQDEGKSGGPLVDYGGDDDEDDW